MQDNPAERRNFHRIIFRSAITLLEPAGQQAQLLDISLKGALLEAPDWTPEPGEPVHIRVVLGEDATLQIEMHARVAHCEDQHIGLEIVSIDLESATALRRLIELNLADPDLLERDLEHLLPQSA